MAKHKTTSSTPATDADDEHIYSTEELLAILPWDRSTLWRKSRDGSYPKPIQLTASRIGWRRSAHRAWLKQREENPIEARAYFGRGAARLKAEGDGPLARDDR